MKLLTLFFILSLSLWADIRTLSSYQAAFKQVVRDEDNVTITYEGMFYAKKPSYTLWRYTKPVTKSVYIDHGRLAIIEPDLEQVITRKYNEKFSLFKLLKEAKKVGKNSYKQIIDGKHYTLKASGNRIQTLSYFDDFDNHVTIYFSKQRPNPKLPNSFFKIRYPEGYDIISK